MAIYKWLEEIKRSTFYVKLIDDRKKNLKEKYRKLSKSVKAFDGKQDDPERELITHQAGHRKYYSKSITQKSITQNALHKKH